MILNIETFNICENMLSKLDHSKDIQHIAALLKWSSFFVLNTFFDQLKEKRNCFKIISVGKAGAEPIEESFRC
jgi:hypothetical protein